MIKRLTISLLILGMIISVFPCSTIMAKVPYPAPWGDYYAKPNLDLKTGRCWYGCGNKGGYYYIYLESYYTYGSAVSISYKYKYNGKNKIATTRGSSKYGSSYTTNYTNSKWKFVHCTIKGNAYRLSVLRESNKKGII